MTPAFFFSQPDDMAPLGFLSLMFWIFVIGAIWAHFANKRAKKEEEELRKRNPLPPMPRPELFHYNRKKEWW